MLATAHTYYFGIFDRVLGTHVGTIQLSALQKKVLPL